MITPIIKRSIIASLLCLISLSVFGFTDNDRVLISMTRDNNVGYLSTNPSGAIINCSENTLTMNSVWEVETISTSGKTYRFRNIGSGLYLSYTTSGRNYSLTCEENSSVIWTVANSESNNSTLTTNIGGTQYVRFSNADNAWKIGTTNYTLNFKVLTNSPISDFVYSGITTTITGVGGALVTEQDLTCNITNSYFDITYGLTKRGREWHSGTISILDTVTTFTEETISLNTLQSLGFVIDINAPSSDNKTSISINPTTNGYHIAATNLNIEDNTDRTYPITFTIQYTGDKDLAGGEVKVGFNQTNTLQFTHLGYHKETISNNLRNALIPQTSKESFVLAKENGSSDNLLLSSKISYYPIGSEIISYHNTIQENCSDELVESNIGTIVPPHFNNYVILLSDGTSCNWCKLDTILPTGEIVVESTAANGFNDTRTAYLNMSFDVTFEGNTIQGTISIPIYQMGMASTTGGRFLHSSGCSNIPGDYNANGTQKVHEYEATIYMIPGGSAKLNVKERDFRGWVRWYDYDSGCSVGAVDGTTWRTAPGNNFRTIPINATGSDTRGLALYNNRNNGSVPEVNTPTGYADTPHRIACDLSNYRDGSWSTEAGSTIIEPTLSYRCIFHLRPAKEMDSLMQTTRNSNKAVEEYKVIMPTNVSNILPTTWLYLKSSTDNTQKCYIYKENNQYHRVGDSNDNQAKTASWYIHSGTTYTAANSDGTAAERGFKLNNHATAETKVYELRTGATANDYTLVRYTVTFKDIHEVGPSSTTIISAADIESNYNILSILDFNYNTPGTTAYTQYGTPLQWEEATSGFAYPGNMGISTNRGHSIEGGGFPFYGEYCFVNKSASNYWYVLENHGGAANGYMMYVDGTEIPGKICTLGTNAYLCAGEKIYCSAWVANIHKDANQGKPILKFVIEGRKQHESTWYEVSQYMTGELPSSQVWEQVNFEVELDQQYEEFRIAVYNFGTGGNGNDFVIDDICIYSITPPLMAYQTASVCQHSDELMQLVFRVDCFSESNLKYLGGKMWYDVIKADATTEDTIQIVPPSPIDLPAHESDVSATWANVKLNEFLENAAMQIGIDGLPMSEVIGYIKEKVGRDERYVMYIVRNLQLHGGTYTMRIAMDSGETPTFTSDCAVNNTFSVSDAISLDVAGLTDSGSETENLCANNYYYISPLFSKLEMNNNGDINKRDGYCYCDWLVNIDTTNNFVNCKNQTGYEYSDIIAALTGDLRVPYFNIAAATLNKNISVSKLTEIDKAYMQNNGENYDMIVDLVTKGFLLLYKKGVDIYMPSESPNRTYIAIPIYGTGRYYDNNDFMDLCIEPIIFTVGVKSHGAKVILGTVNPEDMPEHLRYAIPVSRYSAEDVTTQIDIPIQDLQSLVFKDTAMVIASSDPDFNANSWCAFTPDKHYEMIGDHSDYYQSGDTIFLLRIADTEVPTGKTPLTLKEGYTYTLEIPMKSELGETTIHYVDKDCPIGSAFINLDIVPEYEMWQPGKTDDNKWTNDDNWVMIDPLTWEPVHTSQRGFVPLAHTNVIINNVGDTTSYPIISNLTLEDVINRYTDNHNPEHNVYPDSIKGMDNYYDYRFLPNTCKNIVLRQNAMLLNQDWLNYDNIWVDLTLKSGEWTIVSPAIKGIVSGDMYINRDGDIHSDPFEVPTYSGIRSRDDDYAFWMSLYNRATYHVHSDNAITAAINNSSWGELTNSMSEEFSIGSGVALLGFPPDNKADEEYLQIHLPKQETTYHYYTNGGAQLSLEATINRPDDYGRMAFEPETNRTMSITLHNENASNLFLFGNPTTAYINMYEFLAGNDLPIQFYYFDDNTWQVADSYSTLTATPVLRSDFEENPFFLPPMRAVLIPTKNNTALNTMTIDLSAEMLAVQGFDRKADKPLSANARRRMPAANNNDALSLINIYASNAYGTSHLVIGQSENASNAYVYGEDVELVTTNMDGDYNYSKQSLPITPTNIYTIADDKALSVDILREATTIPLLFTVDPIYHTSTLRLLFDGIQNSGKNVFFVDSKSNTKTKLLDGMQINIATPEDGEARYYLSFNDNGNGKTTAMSNLPNDDMAQILTNRSGRITIITAEPIRNINIYSVSGQLIYQCSSLTLPATQLTAPCPSGIAIVSITTDNQTIIKKIFVK